MARKVLFLMAALCIVAFCQAFVPIAPTSGRAQLARVGAASRAPSFDYSDRKGQMSMMGGKVANFGIFSPAVIVAKVVLGETKLNKIRGKAIALHSQAITEFSYFVGAQGKLRNRLIKKAKTNGDKLGFLW